MHACIKELFDLRRGGIVLGLETIQALLDRLQNPQTKFSTIHIAGTNGKGSIASSLSTILTQTRHHTGLFTSPHLVRFNERIKINNKEITDDEVYYTCQKIKEITLKGRIPTFFEYNTAMAFDVFAAHNVDWAIIETGMGGRLDSTNVILPKLSVITNISLEHTDFLGKTLSEIAFEKAGIIKLKTPIVTGAKQKKVLDIFTSIAKEKKAPLYCLGKEFKIRRNKNGTFTYYGLDHTLKNVRTNLLGNYQIDNAAITLCVCELLIRQGVKTTMDDAMKGLRENIWAGRLELIHSSPRVILDGAHNLIAARNLAKFLLQNEIRKQTTLILGILDDKPYKAMLKILLPCCHRIILTRPKTERALPVDTLISAARELELRGVQIDWSEDVPAALELALQTSPTTETICLAGSLYLVGDAKSHIEKKQLFQ